MQDDNGKAGHPHDRTHGSRQRAKDELDESTATETGDQIADSAKASFRTIMDNDRIYYLPFHPTNFSLFS